VETTGPAGPENTVSESNGTIGTSPPPTTKIPALDTVDYIIIGVTCASVAGVIVLVSVTAILKRRKNRKVISLAEVPDTLDTDEMITKTIPADDYNAEGNVNPILDPQE